MTVFTEKVYATQYSKKMYIDELKKYIYETGCTGCAEPRNIIYKINEHYHNRMGTYRCPAEKTSPGQDMSHWETYRISAFEDYKRDAFRSITPEWVRLVTNCKNLLVSDKYDMFEEFKKGYPHLSNYFDFKNITWDIIGNSHHTNITVFIDCVIACILSKEAEDKQNEKIKRRKDEQLKKEEYQKKLLLKKEFECEKLLSEIDKHKLKSVELYIEYKTCFGWIKNPVGIINTQLIDYFTEDKKLYIHNLLEHVKQYSYTTSSTQTQDNEMLHMVDPSTYCHVESNVIFDSTNHENIIIRVSECNAENGIVPVPDDARPEPPAKKKRGRPSYKSLLLNLERNTVSN